MKANSLEHKKINIALIGNCQTLSLHVYLHDLLKNKNYEIKWIRFGKHVLPGYLKIISHIYPDLISITDDEEGIEYIKTCDYVIYQPILIKTSCNFNATKIKSYCSNTCTQISFISIYIDGDFNMGVYRLKQRELERGTTIKVTDILEKHKDKKLLLRKNHPTTFLFLKLLEQICIHLNIDFFKNTDKYLITDNYTRLGLPPDF